MFFEQEKNKIHTMNSHGKSLESGVGLLKFQQHDFSELAMQQGFPYEVHRIEESVCPTPKHDCMNGNALADCEDMKNKVYPFRKQA